MKLFVLALLFIAVSRSVSLAGKPPTTLKATPAPAGSSAAQAAPGASSSPWLHWLLEQDGGEAAVAATLPELIQTAAGKQVTPFKPADPVDAATASKIGAALDAILPKLNRPEGAVRTAKQLGMIPLLVNDEVQAALIGAGGLSCEAIARNDPTALGDGSSGAYPTLRLVDQASHRVYYFGVAFCPMDRRESALPLLYIDLKAASTRITSDGVCLLVVLEHNSKPGAELAFLNWDLIDLGQAKVRMQTSFRAVTNEVLLPAALLGDGRRGRD